MPPIVLWDDGLLIGLGDHPQPAGLDSTMATLGPPG